MALTRDELDLCKKGPRDFDVLWYNLPESRQELLAMLLDGDAQRLVDCLVAHFEVFAKLIPAMDKAFTKSGEPKGAR